MRGRLWKSLALAALLALGLAAPAPAQWHVSAQTTVTGLGHPESVAWDPRDQTLYLSNFGPPLKPGQKDHRGYISRLDQGGRVLEPRRLPAEGSLHKPKGLWLQGRRLWTADIDALWVFDLDSRQGRRLELPGAVFLNDPVVAGGRLYVSDTQAHRVYQVEPADFLATEPAISLRLEQKDLAPNGLWALPDGALLIASSPRDGSQGSLWRLEPGAKQAQPLTPPAGRLDGLAALPDGTLLFTDWISGGLYALEPSGQRRWLAGRFQGPADFALIPQGGGFLLVLPDLVSGELHFLTLEP